MPIFIISNPTSEMDANMMRSYAAALTTLHHTRHCILIALAVYMVGGLMGWIHADNLTFFHQPAVALADKFEGKHGAGFILALFLHNLVATYITMCTITVWGLVPMVTAMANGLILGWIVVTAISASLVDAAALLVPHGLFEWPAMMIAWGVGLWRGAGYRFSTVPGTYAQRWRKSNQLFFLIVFPLLLAAAIVEGRGHLGDFLPG